MKATQRFLIVTLAVLGSAMLPRPARADAPAWMHAAASAPVPTYDEKTDAVLLYAEDSITVLPDGKTRSIERRVYKILRPDGRWYGQASAYVGRESRVGSMRGWCIPSQGKDYEVKDKEAVERSLGMANGEMMTDMKVRTLQIPAAEPGNIVGYEIEYQGRPYVLEDWWTFQWTIPVKEYRYTLQLPQGWEYKAVWINHPEVAPTPSGNNQWQWIVKDTPAIRREREMPPYQGVAGQMIVSFLAPGAGKPSGFVSWDDMGKWQSQLAAGRRDSTPEINQKVAALVATAKTPQEKMQSIAAFLQKDIRYVAIELGIGGWQPHAAADVFTHRYGDCKDKATLMSTMLKQAGIDSYYVAINVRRGAVGRDTPPMMFLFNHVILAIKLPDEVRDEKYTAILNHPKLGRLLIFDPTDEKTPFGHLRGELQANYGLLVTPDGGDLVPLPQLPTTTNGVLRTGNLTLDAGGTLSGKMVETRIGDFALYERYLQQEVKSSKDQVKRIEQEVSHSIGTFQITSAQMLNLDVTNQPFGYNYTFVAPSYGKVTGNLLLVRPRIIGIKTRDILETKEPRRFPVIFEGPEKDIDTFEIALPAGYEVDDLPPAIDAEYEFASYHSKIEAKGNTLHYSRTFEIKELSVPVEKLDELKKFYRMIASDERNTAVLKPVAH